MHFRRGGKKCISKRVSAIGESKSTLSGCGFENDFFLSSLQPASSRGLLYSRATLWARANQNPARSGSLSVHSRVGIALKVQRAWRSTQSRESRDSVGVRRGEHGTNVNRIALHTSATTSATLIAARLLPRRPGERTNEEQRSAHLRDLSHTRFSRQPPFLFHSFTLRIVTSYGEHFFFYK